MEASSTILGGLEGGASDGGKYSNNPTWAGFGYFYSEVLRSTKPVLQVLGVFGVITPYSKKYSVFFGVPNKVLRSTPNGFQCWVQSLTSGSRRRLEKRHIMVFTRGSITFCCCLVISLSLRSEAFLLLAICHPRSDQPIDPSLLTAYIIRRCCQSTLIWLYMKASPSWPAAE